MSKVRLTGSNSGYVEIAAVADAGNLSFTMPTGGTALIGNGDNVYTGITTFNNDVIFDGATAGYDVVWDRSDNQLEFATNAKATFGNVMQIYHDGNHSYIKNTTGDLILRDDTIELKAVSTTDTYLSATNGGGVSLRYDNTETLVTTSVGVNITGQSTFVRNAGDANFIVGSTNASGAYLVLDGDSNGDAAGGDYAYLLHNSAGNLQIATDNPNSDSTIEFRTNGTHRSTVSATGMFEPALNNTYDLGTSSLRWRNIYTNDLNLSNEGSANSVDGTWGDYTIQEGESDLFLINKRSGKKYKFMLQEVS